MPIPDFQSIMLPLLNLVGDGHEYSTKVVHDDLARHFGLTEDELNQYLPSGKQRTFYNRVFWAKAHLKMAGLLENTRRGFFKITQAGKDVLRTNPSEINIRLLKQYPEYIDNVSGKSKEDQEIFEDAIHSASTPEEILENSYVKIRKALAQELLSKVKSCSPAFFEQLVVDLLVKMGYGGSLKEAGESLGRVGDEGIDGIIKEDRLGLDIIYIQAKRWEGVVGRPELQKFVGALAGQGAKKGVFITTSYFSDDARKYQPKNETKIVLIDGEQLTRYMIDFGLGVTLQQTYEVKRTDNDYFEES